MSGVSLASQVGSSPYRRRVALATVIQETNSFSGTLMSLQDFTGNGVWEGEDALVRLTGTNTEFAGAAEVLHAAGVEVVPLIRVLAWAGGVIEDAAAEWVIERTRELLRSAGKLDGMVFCLHGAAVAESDHSLDATLTEMARSHLGERPLVVTHDLHANVTSRIVKAASAVIGYRTYPHVDHADTGRRAARLILGQLESRHPLQTVLAKRNMIVPAEAQAIAEEPMASLRAMADDQTSGSILDISLFPVQPWLDVPELGFGVTVTTLGDVEHAKHVAEALASAAWDARHQFDLDLHDPNELVANLVRGTRSKPALMVFSADSNNAGAAADSAFAIRALAVHGQGLRAYATVVDAPAVEACWRASAGGSVRQLVGSTLDQRWTEPIAVEGTVRVVGDSPVVLAGEVATGETISMGRWAVLDTAQGLSILLTERPAPTFDPSTFEHVGLDPRTADVIVVRSANLFKAGFRDVAAASYFLDAPGASTPKFRYLPYKHAPRPMYPLDEEVR